LPILKIEVKGCYDCPFLNKERDYGPDSFSLDFNWFCTKANNKKIAGCVGWNEEKAVKMPVWCPQLVRE
jgi:hypothetical protein